MSDETQSSEEKSQDCRDFAPTLVHGIDVGLD